MIVKWMMLWPLLGQISLRASWNGINQWMDVYGQNCVRHQEICHAPETWFKIKHFVSVFMPVTPHTREGEKEKKGFGLTTTVYLTYCWALIGVPQVCKLNNGPKRTRAAFSPVPLHGWWKTQNPVGNLEKGNNFAPVDDMKLRLWSFYDGKRHSRITPPNPGIEYNPTQLNHTTARWGNTIEKWQRQTDG